MNQNWCAITPARGGLRVESHDLKLRCALLCQQCAEKSRGPTRETLCDGRVHAKLRKSKVHAMVCDCPACTQGHTVRLDTGALARLCQERPRVARFDLVRAPLMMCTIAPSGARLQLVIHGAVNGDARQPHAGDGDIGLVRHSETPEPGGTPRFD